MSKLNVNKKALALILAGTIGAGGIGFILKSAVSNEEPKIENQIGYTDINPLFENVDPEDFVVLDIGDHDDYGKIHFQKTKIKYCNENDISLGVIISTDSEKESEIYDDVEYAKGIIRDHKIDFPVYLNIDGIITNDNLNNEMKTKLIKDFCEKCSANNIYVGLYGTDTNLKRVKEYCNITEYDAFLVMDKENIEYDGVYYVYQDMDGNLKTRTNISEAITQKGLNNAEGFANDGSCTISSTEELTDAALRYGMSVNELLEFNELKKNAIKGKTTLRIPSSIATSIPTGEVTYEQLDEPIRGCDISYAQDASPDWEKMSENFDFIIIRSNIGLSEDDFFAKNATQANINNIPMGAYCYNIYQSKDFNSIEEFKKQHEKQADYTISLLKNKKVDYPVYLDIEGIVNSKTYQEEYVPEMLNIWKQKMEEAGYIPGLYCSKSAFEYLSSCVDYKISDQLEVWIAGGQQYSTKEDKCYLHEHISLDNVAVPISTLDNELYGANVAQATNICTNAGAGDLRGHLDIDFATVDYSKRIYETEEQETKQFDIKEFNRVDISGIGTAASEIAATAALVGLGIAGFKKKQKEKTFIRK